MSTGRRYRNRPAGPVLLAAAVIAGLALAPAAPAGPEVCSTTACQAMASARAAGPKPRPTPTPKTCSQLTTRTATRGAVKFGRQGGRVLGCVLPDGPVVLVGTESSGVVIQQLSFVQTTGTFAIFSVSTVENVDGGGSRRSRFAIDLRSGVKRTVPESCEGTTVLGTDGRVVVLSTCSAALAVLQGIPPRGGTVYLDVARDPAEIPPGSVTLDGRAVRWTHGDVARTGRI